MQYLNYDVSGFKVVFYGNRLNSQNKCSRVIFNNNNNTRLTALCPRLRGWACTGKGFTESRDSGWQWHQLGYMQICISPYRQIPTPAHPTTQIFTGRMSFLPPNQQRQRT